MAELRGKVERRRLGAGSKSEHLGVVLVDAQGGVHVLRRAGANAFQDADLQALAGQAVVLLGEAMDSHFNVQSWQVLRD